MALDVQKLEQDAMKALQRGKDQDALNIYLRILQHDPRSGRIRRTVAELHLKLGQQKQAERRFLEVVEAMVKNGQHRQAIPIYKELVRLRPKDHEMFVELGDCQVKSGFENDALDNFTKAVDMTGRQKPDLAQEIQRKIILLKPADFTEKIKLAELLETANWSERAADEWKLLAEQSRQLGRPEDQARFLERAIDMKPDTDGYTLAAKARLSTGDPVRSLELLQRVEKEDKRQPLVLELFGEALMAIGQKDKAQKLWVQSAELRKKERNINQSLHNYRQAVSCGVSDPEIEKAIAKADEQVARSKLRLHLQDWCQPRNEDEMKIVVRSLVMFDYKLYDHAKATLTRCDKKIAKTLSVQTLLVEVLVALQEISSAAETLQKLRVRSPEATEQIAIRLAVITGADDDDELNNDYLNEPDPYFLDMTEETTDDNSDEGTEDSAPTGPSTSDLKQKAEALVLEDQIDQAVDVYTKILDLDPDDESALIRIGELMAMDMSKDEEYKDELQNQGFSDINPSDFDPSRFQIDKADDDSIDDLEDQNETNTSISQPVSESDDSNELMHARAMLLIRKFEEAANESKNIQSLSAAIIYSEAMRSLGKLRQAKSHLQEAMDDTNESDPSYAEALWELIQIYLRGQKAKPASSLLNELEEHSPNYKSRERLALRIGLEELSN